MLEKMLRMLWTKKTNHEVMRSVRVTLLLIKTSRRKIKLLGHINRRGEIEKLALELGKY